MSIEINQRVKNVLIHISIQMFSNQKMEEFR